MTEEELKAREAELDAREAKLAKQETKFKAYRKGAKRLMNMMMLYYDDIDRLDPGSISTLEDFLNMIDVIGSMMEDQLGIIEEMLEESGDADEYEAELSKED